MNRKIVCIELFDIPFHFNVWVFSSGKAECVLSCFKAENRVSAINAAIEKLNK